MHFGIRDATLAPWRCLRPTHVGHRIGANPAQIPSGVFEHRAQQVHFPRNRSRLDLFQPRVAPFGEIVASQPGQLAPVQRIGFQRSQPDQFPLAPTVRWRYVARVPAQGVAQGLVWQPTASQLGFAL